MVGLTCRTVIGLGFRRLGIGVLWSIIEVFMDWEAFFESGEIVSTDMHCC
jgi:hypothetical protein